MNDPDQIRRQVSECYTQAVQTPAASCCGGDAVQKGVAVQCAGYTADELRSLPPDAAENAFGCGNPLALSEVKAGQTVLDLGAGAGIDILLAGQKVGPRGRVIGIDMTDAMIERARENIAASGMSHVEVRKGVIEDLPVDAATVDWVISNCVINLSPEKPRVFSEIARVLKTGGCMLVSDLVADDLPPAVRSDPALYSSCIAGAISEAAYVSGLAAAGLVNVEVRSRFAYDSAQLRAMARSEVGATSCCGAGLPAEDVVAALEGRVQSVMIFARKR